MYKYKEHYKLSDVVYDKSPFFAVRNEETGMFEIAVVRAGVATCKSVVSHFESIEPMIETFGKDWK